ncbi:MAG: hypothetical protein MUF75_09540 [Bacteroidia bacterium]|jgi:hypothetical protein|nr:hypothetical protein [Bacteroidia bacterium]
MFLIITILFGLSCNLNSNEIKSDEAIILQFEVFNNDSMLALLTNENGISKISIHTFYSEEKKTIYTSSEEDEILSIDISPDNRSILFISTPKGNQVVSTLFQIDLSSGSIKLFEFIDYLATKALFTEDPNLIILLMAKEINNYSPLGSELPHKFDLYSFSSIDSKLKKITNLNAFYITKVCIENRILYFNISFEGPYTINLESSQQNINSNPSLIAGKEDKSCGQLNVFLNKLYYTNVGSTFLYELDLNTKVTKNILQLNYQISNIRSIQNNKEIMFLKFDQKNISIFNLETKKMRTLALNYF